MTTGAPPGLERELLRKAVARLRASVMAVVFGLVGGSGMFVATAWLLIQGGESVGAHLSLLNNYFLGYSVTWTGSVIGFLYGGLSGGVVGWAVAWIYNRIAYSRNPT